MPYIILFGNSLGDKGLSIAIIQNNCCCYLWTDSRKRKPLCFLRRHKKLFVFILICTMNSSSVDEKQFVQNNTVRRISYIFSLHIRYPSSSSSSLKARKIMFACYRPRCVSAFKTCFRVSFSRCEDRF